MPNLTQIVRPFVVVGTTPPQLAPSASGTAPPSNVVINIGKGGSAKILSTSAASSVTTYMTGQNKEIKSKSGP